MSNAFDFSAVTNPKLQPPAVPWGGFPKFNFVGGHNDADSVPVQEFRQCLDRIMTERGRTLATYFLESGPQGDLALREFLVKKLAHYADIKCQASDILLTSGSSQAMDLINTALVREGDVVVVEESNYGGALSRFNRLGVEMVTVPLDAEGMQTDKLATAVEQLAQQGRKPKFIYTIPTVHNPTGTIMSLSRREHLLAIAREYDLAIYEDECYADLVWAEKRPPSLYALDNDGRVVHIGTFSKTVAPALRVGYILADWSLLGQLLAVKTDAGSGALEQMLLAEYCEDNFIPHVSALNKTLKEKLDCLTDAVDREFGSSAHYDKPPGGIFLWLKLPAQVDTSKLALAAAEEGVAINPGAEWSHNMADSQNWLRLCFANPDKATIEQGVAKLAQVCHREFGVPVTGSNQLR